MEENQTETINIQITQNEISVSDCELYSLAWELYWWVDFFNISFFKNEPVPVPVISFERTRISSYDHCVIGRNAFGFRNNININRVHLGRPMWDILATLIHEMAHSWQHMYGKPSRSWYHNNEFRFKLLDFGTLTDDRGCYFGLGDPFIFLLRRHGVLVTIGSGVGPMTLLPRKEKVKGKYKLKKWTCGCTNIRVAVPDFKAKCLKCKNRFELVE